MISSATARSPFHRSIQGLHNTLPSCLVIGGSFVAEASCLLSDSWTADKHGSRRVFRQLLMPYAADVTILHLRAAGRTLPIPCSTVRAAARSNLTTARARAGRL